MKINCFSIWNIIYWGPHLSPQPTCMLFFRYYLWVLVHLNYRDIKGGGGVTGPPGPPPSYAPDEEKKILPSLVYILNKTWNLALSCPGRAVMAKKMFKKAWCTCRVVALPIRLNLLPFWRSLCRRRCGILKSLMMIFLCCLCWLIISKPQRYL